MKTCYIYDHIMLNSKNGNALYESSREKQNTFYKLIFFCINCAIYETLWKNVLLTDMPHISMVQSLSMLEYLMFSNQ